MNMVGVIKTLRCGNSLSRSVFSTAGSFGHFHYSRESIRVTLGTLLETPSKCENSCDSICESDHFFGLGPVRADKARIYKNRGSLANYFAPTDSRE